MLLVRTKVLPSPIHGLGLFADENIPKGTIIWEFEPGFDLVIDSQRVQELPEAPKQWMKHYAHLSKKNGKYTLSMDNDRYINHAADPNTIDIDTGREELATVARRDIRAGEELTCDYLAYSKESALTDEFM
jgi:uncharacterized protein